MTKILIIEDEIPARNKLKRFIESLDSPTEVMAELDTVESSLNFLKANQPDLIFSDIELLDGNAFEIYCQISIHCPIIFTTAYDQFWMNAFESNGIDYLLKPFTLDRFRNAWDKFQLLTRSTADNLYSINTLTKLIQQNLQKQVFKKRFTVQNHHGIYFLETDNILFFEANDGVVFAHDENGKKHLINESSLKELEAILNPDDFFRINRSELIQKKFIQQIERYNKNTLSIQIKNWNTHLITSQSNTAAFRDWLRN